MVVFWWFCTRGRRRSRVGGVIPHLQCSAGLHHPIISQLSVKGAGPEADDSQGEFSVRQSECEREKVSESQRGKQLCLVLQDLVYRGGSTFLFLPSFRSAPSLLFHCSSLCHRFLWNLCFSLVPADCRLLFVLHSYFSLSILLLFPPFSLLFAWFLSLWMEWEACFLNTCSLSCPPPSVTSHGHPCILQVRAGRVSECGQMWQPQTVRGWPWDSSRWFVCCRSLWGVLLVVNVMMSKLLMDCGEKKTCISSVLLNALIYFVDSKCIIYMLCMLTFLLFSLMYKLGILRINH